MKSSVNIIATDPNGKKIQKAITDINPNASTAQLRDFVQNLNGLTNNTLGTPVRIDRTELVDESGLLNPNFGLQGGTTKSFNDLIIDPETYSTGVFLSFSYDIDNVPPGLIHIKSNTTCIPFSILTIELENPAGEYNHFLFGGIEKSNYESAIDQSTLINKTGTVVIALDAYGGYKSAEITLTITE